MLLLVACMTQESVLPRTSAVVCNRFAECDQGTFESLYDSVAECRDDYESALEGYVACLNDACTFVPAAAAGCLADYRRASCEEVTAGDPLDDCASAWVECDESELLLCTLDEIL